VHVEIDAVTMHPVILSDPGNAPGFTKEQFEIPMFPVVRSIDSAVKLLSVSVLLMAVIVVVHAPLMHTCASQPVPVELHIVPSEMFTLTVRLPLAQLPYVELMT
jgi:hypothetical protein